MAVGVQWEVKIYDVTADQWIALDQDLVLNVSIENFVSESVQAFELVYDEEDLGVEEEDIVIVNIGLIGSDMVKKINGVVEAASREGGAEDRRLRITGKGWGYILLLDKTAPNTTYQDLTGTSIIDNIISDLKKTGTSYIDDERVFCIEKNVWIPLACNKIVLGAQSKMTEWGDYFVNGFDEWGNFVVDDMTDVGDFIFQTEQIGAEKVTDLTGTIHLTEGIDYEMDYDGGRIKFLDTAKVIVGSYYLIDYTTSAAHFKLQELTIFGLDITKKRTLTTKGMNKWTAISKVCTQLIPAYDFWIDANKNLDVFERDSRGPNVTLYAEDLDNYSSHKTNAYLINQMTVYGAQISDSIPEDPDEWTDFPTGITPADKGWTKSAKAGYYFDVAEYDYYVTKPDVSGQYGVDQQYNGGAELSTSFDTSKIGIIGANFLETSLTEDGNIFRVKKSKSSEPGWDLSLGEYSPLEYYLKFAYTNTGFPKAYVLCKTSDADYFQKEIDLYTAWTKKQYTLPSREGTGWVSVGSPLWNQIMAVEFVFIKRIGMDMVFSLDYLHFGQSQIVATYYDQTSIDTYGVRTQNPLIPYPYVDPNIITFAEAEQIAESIVVEYKDPLNIISGIECEYGEPNITPGDLVKIIEEDMTELIERVVKATEKLNEGDYTTSVECKAGSPSGVEARIRSMEKDVKQLEMGKITAM